MQSPKKTKGLGKIPPLEGCSVYGLGAAPAQDSSLNGNNFDGVDGCEIEKLGKATGRRNRTAKGGWGYNSVSRVLALCAEDPGSNLQHHTHTTKKKKKRTAKEESDSNTHFFLNSKLPWLKQLSSTKSAHDMSFHLKGQVLTKLLPGHIVIGLMVWIVGPVFTKPLLGHRELHVCLMSR